MTRSRHILSPRRPWTAQELRVLRQHYPDKRAAQVARMLGCDVARVSRKANQLGLRKSAVFLASDRSGRFQRGMQDPRIRATQFKASQTPWNKDTHYVAGGRSAETRFKSGMRQGRAEKVWQPIGAERLSKDGYLQRKVNEGLPMQKRWRAVHLIIWEHANGPLPGGHAVVFRNGDKRDLRIENLQMVTRAELMLRNSYHNRYPKDVARLIQLKGALNRKINRHQRQSAESQP